MKHILIALITLYQNIFSSVLKQILGTPRFCRFTPSCSEYAKQIVRSRGIMQGSFLALTRFIQCQPFTKQNFTQ